MKSLSLRIRISLLCGFILIGMVAVITVVNVYNAEDTYIRQFSMNIGDEFNITIDSNKVSLNAEDDKQNNQMMDFINQLIPDEIKEELPEFSLQSGVQKTSFGSMFQGAEKKFTIQSILVAAFFALLGLLLIYIIVGRALKPVRKLSEVVKKINENNLCERIQTTETKDEIGSLTISFNQMLDRLSNFYTIQANFAANAAHELCTPLATIKAGIQVFEMESNPSLEECKETIEIMKESNERLIKIVENLLLISRESQEGFAEPVVLKDVFHKIQKELIEMAEEAEVSIIIINSEGIFQGNSTLICRAVFNLVENGIKYNKKGGTVTMDSCELGEKLLIRVSDDGPGIPEESIEHIFEPFYRVDKSRSRAIGGSGLGLSIVKSIIDRHNGTICVESVLGMGTVFTVEIQRFSH